MVLLHITSTINLILLDKRIDKGFCFSFINLHKYLIDRIALGILLWEIIVFLSVQWKFIRMRCRINNVPISQKITPMGMNLTAHYFILTSSQGLENTVIEKQYKRF